MRNLRRNLQITQFVYKISCAKSPLIEHSICDLTRKVSKFVPDFRLNEGYRVRKISDLFSHLAKAQIDKFDKSNVTYYTTAPAMKKI